MTVSLATDRRLGCRLGTRQACYQPPGRTSAVRLSPRIDSVEAGGVGASPRRPGGWWQTRTGRCLAALAREVLLSVGCRCSSDQDPGQGRVAGEQRLTFRALLVPELRVPDLEVGERADHDDLALERRVLAQRRRDRHPALLVRDHVAAPGEDRAGDASSASPPSRAISATRATTVSHSLAGVDGQARRLPGRDHRAARQGVTELGREVQSSLVVEGVLRTPRRMRPRSPRWKQTAPARGARSTFHHFQGH